MRLFECEDCGQPLYFENTHCERCGRKLGFLPEMQELSALSPAGNAGPNPGEAESWTALATPGRQYRFCANAQYDACNWLIAEEEFAAGESFCLACRHNNMVPDLSVAANVANWRLMEQAKHRLFYTILRLGLPHEDRKQEPEEGLAFDFLVDLPDPHAKKVMTGHSNGLITINLVEADDAERERLRKSMNEPYRTLVGHFRHEIGHYYWDRLVERGQKHEPFRVLFGDERADYGEALQRHYSGGPRPDWQNEFVSAYATMHPWEDFAETWAHYLHIVDTLETADAFGLRVRPKISRGDEMHARVDFDPYRTDDMQRLIDAFLPLTFAVNSLNRSMGQPDLYPFVLSPRAIEKLGFVHQLVKDSRARGT